MESINSYLDFANHHPNATEKDIKELCKKVLDNGFNSAFVNPANVSLAREEMGEWGKVGTIVSFPLGQETLEIKVLSAQKYAQLGADELDVSLNVGYLKQAMWNNSLEEMKRVVEVVKQVSTQKIVKFILETGFLTVEEIKKGSELILESGADFIKTCSGMGPRGAEISDVKTIREAIGDKIRVKVAGGVDSYEEAMAFIEAGVNRIGTSHAVEIANKSGGMSDGKGE